MKFCPTCRRAYTDETLSFCLEDGASLLRDDSGPATISDPSLTIRSGPPSHRSEVPTEVLSSYDADPETSRRSESTIAQQPRITARENYTPPQPPKTHNTTLVVGLTVVATLILIALGALGAWFLFKGEKSPGPTKTEVNQNEGGQPPTVNNSPDKGGTPGANVSPSPGSTATPPPVNAEAVREEVTAALNGWTSASRAHDLDKHMSYYADTLDTYYNASNVNASRVRADRSRAYALYSTIDIELSNVKITVDPSGDRASAVLDKTWTFEGTEKYSSGSVHQKIWLVKTGGRWRITGEKDLQVYYVNRER
jgi:ketosteroid isomerase-like protein